MNRGYALVILALGVLVIVGPTSVAGDPGPGGLPSLSCFYECKPGPMVDGKPTLREITTLMLGSSGGREMVPYATTSGPMIEGPGIEANIRIYDGNQNLVATTFTLLSANDLDEINICATIRNATSEGCLGDEQGPCDEGPACCPGLFCAGVNGTSECREATAQQAGAGGGPGPGPQAVPEAGLIRIDLFDENERRATTSALIPDGPPPPPPPPPVHVWVKNLLGRFFVERDEPFEGRVTGIAKTQCMIGPPSALVLHHGIHVDPVLVENTADARPLPGFPCDGGDGFPVCDGDCPPDYDCVAIGGEPATTSGVLNMAECRCLHDD